MEQSSEDAQPSIEAEQQQQPKKKKGPRRVTRSTRRKRPNAAAAAAANNSSSVADDASCQAPTKLFVNSPSSVASNASSTSLRGISWVEHFLPQGLLSPYLSASSPRKAGQMQQQARRRKHSAPFSSSAASSPTLTQQRSDSAQFGREPDSTSARVNAPRNMLTPSRSHTPVASWVELMSPYAAQPTGNHGGRSMSDASQDEAYERQRWIDWAIAAAETERRRRIAEVYMLYSLSILFSLSMMIQSRTLTQQHIAESTLVSCLNTCCCTSTAYCLKYVRYEALLQCPHSLLAHCTTAATPG
jgi:hypothetical protein